MTRDSLVQTPEEVEMRAFVECYSEGQPSTELQYLIFALKIIDELRDDVVQIRDELHGMKVEFQDEDGITELTVEILRLRALVESKLQQKDTPT